MNADPIIDVHLHLWEKEMYGKRYMANVKSENFYGGFGWPLNANVTQLAEVLDAAEAKIGRPYRAFVQTLDHGVNFGMETTISQVNDYTADSVVQDKKGRLIGFAGVDPRRGEEAIIELDRAIMEKGLRGLKLYPPFGFYPDDRIVYPIYEKIIELQKELHTTLPVLIHQGVASCGSKYCRPANLDEVATNFEPDLKIIAAHAGVPWIDEMIFVTAVHRTLYFDICCIADLLGLWPEYYAEVLGKAKRANILDKVLFASDWPCICFLLKPENPAGKLEVLGNWVNVFKGITTPSHLKGLGYPEITDEEKERILSQNAKAILPSST